jgi:glycerophosphoryl diester phosphodiesterase
VNKNDLIIIAHRGESYDAPENTLASINLAWERNAYAVEVDVRLTKDEKIILIHDKSTWRTGGVYKRVASNYYDQLLKVDVGKFKGTKWKNERIPLLTEVIETIPAEKKLFVEIKSGNKIIKPLENVLSQKNINPDQIKFIGFNIKTMKLVKKTFPQYESYWILEKREYKTEYRLKKVIDKCLSANLNGLDVEESKFLNRDVIQNIKEAGLKIYTWTVDDTERAGQLVGDGIHGITTNRAHWLKTKLTEEKII